MLPSLNYLDDWTPWRLGKSETDLTAPLRAMRIVDGTSRLVRARRSPSTPTEIGEEAFGYQHAERRR